MISVNIQVAVKLIRLTRQPETDLVVHFRFCDQGIVMTKLPPPEITANSYVSRRMVTISMRVDNNRIAR